MEIEIQQVEGCFTTLLFMSTGKSEKFTVSMSTDSSTPSREASETCEMIEYHLSTEKSRNFQTNFEQGHGSSMQRRIMGQKSQDT